MTVTACSSHDTVLVYSSLRLTYPRLYCASWGHHWNKLFALKSFSQNLLLGKPNSREHSVINSFASNYLYFLLEKCIRGDSKCNYQKIHWSGNGGNRWKWDISFTTLWLCSSHHRIGLFLCKWNIKAPDHIWLKERQKWIGRINPAIVSHVVAESVWGGKSHSEDVWLLCFVSALSLRPHSCCCGHCPLRHGKTTHQCWKRYRIYKGNHFEVLQHVISVSSFVRAWLREKLSLKFYKQ